MNANRDRVVEDMVRQRLMSDSRIAGQAVSVSSAHGYVEIIGIVDSEEMRDLVLDLAQGVMGVRHVEDLLRIRREQAA